MANVPLFRSLAADAIAALDTQCSWRRAPGGQWIIDYQDANRDVFFVVTGAVRVVIQSAGREVLLRQINAGEFFGELAAIDNAPRSSGIVAMTDVTVGIVLFLIGAFESALALRALSQLGVRSRPL